MEKIKFDKDLSKFDRILLIYKNENGDLHLGHLFFYNGRDSKYLLFLYKDKLRNENIIESWNYLDDTAFDIKTIGIDNQELAVDDFLAVWQPNKSWRDIDYYEVDNFVDVNATYLKIKLENNSVVAFVFKD